jgi:Histone methylation protein DOT1
VLGLEAPDPPPTHPPDGMVFYQPTPARHIFHLFRLTALSESDVLIDLGSGLGHVPLLASICTGARSIGVEREGAYIASAQRCVQDLHLDRVSFLQQDAREADLSQGTVFYLYTPFTGAILAEGLRQLQRQSESRPIRVCTFGPCTETIVKEKWLVASTEPNRDHVTVFCSHP